MLLIIYLFPMAAYGQTRAINNPCFQGNGPLCLSVPSGCEGESTEEFCMACDVVRSLNDEGKAKSCSKQTGYQLIKKIFSTQFMDCEKTCLCKKNSKVLGCTEKLWNSSKVTFGIYREPESHKKNNSMPQIFQATSISSNSSDSDAIAQENAPNDVFHHDPSEDSNIAQEDHSYGGEPKDFLDFESRNKLMNEFQSKVTMYENELNEIHQEINKQSQEQSPEPLEMRKLELKMRLVSLKIRFYSQQINLVALPNQEREKQSAFLREQMNIDERQIRQIIGIF